MTANQGKIKYLGVSLLLLFPISALLVFSSGLSTGPELPATSQPTEVLSKINTIKAEELKEWLDQGRSFLLLDARSPEEFAAGHIPTAVNLRPHRTSNGGVKVEDSEVPIVLYCTGHSGSKNDPCFRAIVREFQNGSSQVYWFKEGMRAWRTQGYPVMTSAK